MYNNINVLYKDVRCVRALLVYNKYSAKNKMAKKIEYICSTLKSKYEIVECFKSTHPKSITEFICTKVDVYDLIVIVGGDGTVHEVINGIMSFNKKPRIACIPAGTCNDTAATLGIKKNLKKTVKIILENEPSKIDVFKINEKYFIYGLAAGCLTEVSYDANQKEKRSMGKFAYYLQSLRLLNKTNNINIQFESEEKKITGTFSIFLALNTRYLAGFKLHRNKKITLNDGSLRLTLIKKTKKLFNIFDFGMFMLFGEAYKHNIIHFDSSEFTITSQTPIAYNTDGEKYAPTNVINVKTIPQALEVVVAKKVKKKFFVN